MEDSIKFGCHSIGLLKLCVKREKLYSNIL
jgi:hypothetical protein